MKQLPIPPNIWDRIAAFLVPGKHGRVEIDVIDGKVVQLRLIESVKPTEDKREGGMAA